MADEKNKSAQQTNPNATTAPTQPPQNKPAARGKVLGKVRYAALTTIKHGYLNDKGENTEQVFEPGDEVPAEVAEGLWKGEERGLVVSNKQRGKFAAATTAPRDDSADEDDEDEA